MNSDCVLVITISDQYFEQDIAQITFERRDSDGTSYTVPPVTVLEKINGRNVAAVVDTAFMNAIFHRPQLVAGALPPDDILLSTEFQYQG